MTKRTKKNPDIFDIYNCNYVFTDIEGRYGGYKRLGKELIAIFYVDLFGMLNSALAPSVVYDKWMRDKKNDGEYFHILCTSRRNEKTGKSIFKAFNELNAPISDRYLPTLIKILDGQMADKSATSYGPNEHDKFYDDFFEYDSEEGIGDIDN